MVKTCSKCHVELPLSKFYADKSKPNGHRSECRACALAYVAAHREERAAYGVAWRTANRAKGVAYSLAYYHAHREERAAYGAAYNAAHRDEQASYMLAWRLRRTYNLTLAERDEMLEEQGGLCAGGCGLPATDVDHCHDCEDVNLRGSIRGILCRLCNQSLDHIARFSPVHAAYLAAHTAVCPARIEVSA